MMQPAAFVELLVAAVLIAIAFVPRLLRCRPAVTDASAVLLTAMPIAAIVVPSVIISLSDNLRPLRIADNNLLTLIVGLPTILLIVGAGVLGIRRRRRPALGAFAIAAQCGLAASLALSAGQGWVQPLCACVLAVVTAFAFSRPDGAALLQWGASTALLALVVLMGVAVILDPAQFLGPCRGDKCSLAGVVVVQGLSGNNLGIYLAAFAPMALIGLSVRSFLPAVVGLGLVVDLTSARAALFGYLAAVVVLALRFIPRLRRSRAAALTVLGVVVALAALPFYRDWGRYDFTWRGQLWARAKELVAERPVLGWGPAFWTGQPRTPNFPNYGTHNALLEVLVSTGAVGLALLLVAFALLTIEARARALEFVSLLVPIFVTGALESTLATQRYTILFGFLPIYLAVVYGRQLAPRALPRHAAGRPLPVPERALEADLTAERLPVASG